MLAGLPASLPIVNLWGCVFLAWRRNRTHFYVCDVSTMSCVLCERGMGWMLEGVTGPVGSADWFACVRVDANTTFMKEKSSCHCKSHHCFSSHCQAPDLPQLKGRTHYFTCCYWPVVEVVALKFWKCLWVQCHVFRTKEMCLICLFYWFYMNVYITPVKFQQILHVFLQLFCRDEILLQVGVVMWTS